MMKFLRRSKELPREEEFYNNIYVADGGLVAFKTVWVNTTVKGNVYCFEELLIEEDAVISGDITCKKCHIKGTVNGNISVLEMFTIDENACIQGNITSRFMEAAPGSYINGAICITDGLAMPGHIAKLVPGDLKKYGEAAPITPPAPAAIVYSETVLEKVLSDDVNLPLSVTEPAELIMNEVLPVEANEEKLPEIFVTPEGLSTKKPVPQPLNEEVVIKPRVEGQPITLPKKQPVVAEENLHWW